MDNAYWKNLTNIKTYTDSTDPALVYVWTALIWTLPSEAGWSIKAIVIAWDTTSEEFPIVNWKESWDMKFEWDNRASYTYLSTV